MRQEIIQVAFQWAPTLGGECYHSTSPKMPVMHWTLFQWAPTLGGECYEEVREALRSAVMFQWAPTLRGECY